MSKPIVYLSPEQTQVHLSDLEASAAISAAHTVTMSPHEWEWTPAQQAAMARYVLWAHQRLCGIKQLATETHLPHQS